ncbi:MAG: YigZ family protein [Chloroflexota bacterium]
MEIINRLLVPAQEIRREFKVQNSRFIATLAYADSVDAARTIITRIQKEFPDASHHIPAFIIGHGASQLSHCSDAGEPSGSAGRPVLAVLKGSGLGDVVVVVTRYFGGTNLGIGGLVRAYGDAVRTVINNVPRAYKLNAHTIRLEYSYPYVERIRLLAQVHVGQIVTEDFGSDVIMTAHIPVENLSAFECDIAELTNGVVKVEVTTTSEILLPILNSG